MAVTKKQKISNNFQEEAPPIFKSWFGWYSFVLGILFIELIIFSIIAVAF